MSFLAFFSNILVPLVLFYIIGFGVLSRRPVFDDFLKGAADGIRTVAGILPTLVGLMTAVGVLRASGFLDFLGEVLTVPASFLHVPPPLVPLLIIRLISNSAAIGLLLDIFREFGADSFTGMAASILMSCTETVFYCLSVYFGSVNVTKTRYTLAGALIATAAGTIAAIFLASL
ncbi:MAG TPA: spore maturation protein [Candidatus Lachnoclostridium stercorigallinarum]|uniref:Spore maturation protein n=1 Tax=Candidatus Lachnoclostridium stercorigallinarum TaxID=2838634 RepID=A0A9D2GF13_9FIRM|nr:spore maturation protein [Candidatus Lachnoclostridium stercorigallinarum]